MRGDARTLQVEEISPNRRNWTVWVYQDYLRFVAEEGSGCLDVEIGQADQEIFLHAPRFGKPVLTILQARKVCFRLGPEHVSVFKAWLGPPSSRSLRAILKQQMTWGMGVGIFLIISSLPKAADPEAQLQALPFDPVAGALGSSLILLRLLSWILPCRELFLADAAWFLMLGGKVGYDVLSGSSAIWLIVTLLCVVAAVGGFEKYQQFGNLADDHARSPANITT